MSKVTNNFHIAGNYIAEQHIDIHDNHNCPIYATSAPEQQAEDALKATPYPKQNDYVGLVAWLEEQKAKGVDYYAAANMNRSKMCRELSAILGWTVDQNSLRKAQER